MVNPTQNRGYQSRLADPVAGEQHQVAAEAGAPLEPSGPGPQVGTDWTNGYGRNMAGQNLYNAEIAAAVREWSGLDPLVLKSILAQESSFRRDPNASGGYRGVAQLGRTEARSAGLTVTRGVDERLDPRKAIPAAAKVLRDKAERLQASFDRYGAPSGDDYWRFVSAAYNGGEGTIALAMRYAYEGRPNGEVKWSDLTASPDGNVRNSPLYRAVAHVIKTEGWHTTPWAKYKEISEYAQNVVARARQ